MPQWLGMQGKKHVGRNRQKSEDPADGRASILGS